MSLPPGPRLPRPLQTVGWVTRPGPWLLRLRARYGDAFTLRVAHEGTWVMLSDPAAVKQVFTGDPAKLHAGEANVVLRPLLGPSSVLLLDEGPHLRQRKLLLPPFHGERMKAYGELISAVAEREVASWPENAAVAVRPRMQRLTLEIVMRAIFGVSEGERLDRLRAALTALLEWTLDPMRVLLVVLAGPKRLERMRFFRDMLGPLDALIAEEIARRRLADDLAERDDVLSLLLAARHEDGSPMSDAELRDELVTLLVAGHETTATALAWALERLARHPAAWARLQAEVAAGEDAYLEAVVRETLRLRPVLTIVLRKLTEPMEIGGWELPAGINVAPCIYLLHRREDVYPDPAAFRPERFLETPPGTYTWIPFGGGIRRCLGASFAQFEMATVLRVIAARRGSLAPERPGSEPAIRRAVTLAPAREGRVLVGQRGATSSD
jgi:cytochrome P450 family 135